jgi:hypothetical protein
LRKLLSFGCVAWKADANILCVRFHLRSTGLMSQRDCGLHCEARRSDLNQITKLLPARRAAHLLANGLACLVQLRSSIDVELL